MSNTQQKASNAAAKVISYFKLIKGTDQAEHFMGKDTFPHNACEYSSFFFLYYLEKFHSEIDARVIRAEDQNSRAHFWVIADGLIYDLTADQFECVQSPIIGEKETSLRNKFPEQAIQQSSEMISKNTLDMIDFDDHRLIQF